MLVELSHMTRNCSTLQKQEIMYELYVDKFAGNFKNLSKRLAYLKNLGVNTLWILPFFPCGGKDAGYDVTDYKNVRKDLGTLNDFGKFVQKAKNNDIQIVIDLVLNHTSNKHPWFISATTDHTSPYKDYYIWTKKPNILLDTENPFKRHKASNWVKLENTDLYYFATFYKEQPDLNWQNELVFEEFKQIIRFWANLGVKGFRLDAVKYLSKHKATKELNSKNTHLIVKKLRAYIDSLKMDLFLIAEADMQIEKAAEFFGKGDECHKIFNFELAANIWQFISLSDEEPITRCLNSVKQLTPQGCTWINFITNHDTLPIYILSPEKRLKIGKYLDPTCKFSESLGNRIGMRLAQAQGPDFQSIVEVFRLLKSIGYPFCIYSGDEVGQKNERFHAKPKDIRNFVRGPFPWKEAEKQLGLPHSLLEQIKDAIK